MQFIKRERRIRGGEEERRREERREERHLGVGLPLGEACGTLVHACVSGAYVPARDSQRLAGDTSCAARLVGSLACGIQQSDTAPIAHSAEDR